MRRCLPALLAGAFLSLIIVPGFGQTVPKFEPGPRLMDGSDLNRLSDAINVHSSLIFDGNLPALPKAYLGNIATGIYVPNTFNASFHQVSFRAHHVARNAGSPVTHAFVLLPCYYSPVSSTSAETPLGAPTTWTASIEYPSGTYNVVTFGGSQSGTCTDGTIFQSDDIVFTTPIPDGAHFWVNGHLVNSAGVPLHNGGGYDVNNGGAAVYGTTTTDYTQAPGIVDQNAAWLTDLGVIAQTKQRGFVFLASDSRTAGYGSGSFQDAFNTAGPDLGNLARSVGRFAPYINEGIPSTTVSSWLASHTNMLQLAAYASDAIIEGTINDVFAGNSAATIEANLQAVRALLPATMPVSLTTSEPASTLTSSSVTSLVANGNGLAVTMASATSAGRLQIGETVTIAGATPSTDNGPCTVTSIAAPVVNCVSSVATGTATATGTITLTDGYQSPYLHTAQATNAVRAAVNDWKLNLPLSLSGFSHVLNIADVVEAGHGSGKWNNGSQFAIPGASFFAETNDGVHATQQGYALIQRSGVANAAALR